MFELEVGDGRMFSSEKLVLSYQSVRCHITEKYNVMKSSCHFFNHLAMPTQFSDSMLPVSVLRGTNLYSLTSSV
jgi:hypothetical protein